jgi:hypothetical protein
MIGLVEMLKYGAKIQKDLPKDHILVKVAEKLGAKLMMGLAAGIVEARKTHKFSKEEILTGVKAFIEIVDKIDS